MNVCPYQSLAHRCAALGLLMGFAVAFLAPAECLAEGYYQVTNGSRFAEFEQAEAAMRATSVQHAALVLTDTHATAWYYRVPSVPIALGQAYFRAPGVGPFGDEGAVVEAFANVYFAERPGLTFCDIGDPSAGEWSSGEVWGPPWSYVRERKTYQWKYTTDYSPKCSNPTDHSVSLSVERITPFSCPPQTPEWNFDTGMCVSHVTGSIGFYPDGEAFYLSADKKTRSTPPHPHCGPGSNPKKANPCDAVTGDKVEQAVDFVLPGGLALSRTFTTPTGRWLFDFEANITESMPGGYVDYDTNVARSAVFRTQEEACELGWYQIASAVEPGLTGSRGVLNGSECDVMVDGVMRFRVAVHGYIKTQPPPSHQFTVEQPDGTLSRYKQQDDKLVPVDPGMTRQLTTHAAGYALQSAGGERQEYDATGQKSAYTRDGHTFTITRAADQVTVADEFGRSYTATYTAGHVTRVDLPDQSTIDYAWEDGNLVQVTFRKGESVETEEYGYESKGGRSLLASHSYNGVPYAAWSYDDLGRATLSRHAAGAESVVFEYHDGYTTVTESLGDVRLFHTALVNNTARLSYIDDRAGKVYERRTYDPSGFVDSSTDALGHVTTYLHDEWGRETSRTEGFGTESARTITTTWDPEYAYLPATITTPTRVTAYRYTTAGRVTSKMETDRQTGRQRITTITYVDNAEGRLVTVDGPRSDVADSTQLRYDSAGNLTSITNALGHITRFADHDGAGRPRTVTDPNGWSAQLDYDGRGRINYLRKGTEVTRLTYTPAGDLRTATLPSGEAYTFTWDDARRLRTIADGAGNRIEYALDALGNHTEEKVFAADGTQTRHVQQVFNTLGQLWQTLNASGELTAEYGYNDNEALTTLTDGLDHTTARTYDALNRLHEVTDARNGIATYTWRSDDLIESVTDPNRNTTHYEYNGFGDLVRQESPDTGVTTLTYDEAGNLLTRTDARGQTATYTYDALNRLTTANYTDGTVTYTWDTAPDNGLGRLAAIHDFSGTTRYNYDPLGRVKAKRQITLGRELTTLYAYDGAGRLKTLTYPSGMVVTYRWSGEKVTEVLANGYRLLTDIAYEPFAGPVRWTFRNGQVHDRTLNLDGQLTAHTLGSEARRLTYNVAGNITQISDRQTTDLGYDELNRLTSATSPVFTLGWDYDANGNRQHLTSALGTTTYAYVPGSNRLSAIDGETYALVHHDPNGNRTGDGHHTYQYDPRDRLITVDHGATATYLYNALGQRVGKQTTAGRRGFVYEGWKLLGEYDPDGHALQETLWLGDLPVVTVQTGVSYYIHPDHLGTPRVIAEQSGKTVWQWDSEPFGSDEANEDPDGDGVRLGYGLRFPGQYYDGETGHHYNHFRYYDPSMGRYTTSDPIGLNGGLNTYTYVDGSPMMYVDPLGLAACTVLFPDYPIDTGFGFTSSDLGGHGGVLSYDAQGSTRYYEFGRYSPSDQYAIGDKRPAGDGNVRRVPVPDLVIDPKTGQPTPASLEALKKALSEKAGHKTKTELTCDKDADEKKVNKYAEELAKNKNRLPYSWKPWSSNQCRNFASRAFGAGR